MTGRDLDFDCEGSGVSSKTHRPDSKLVNCIAQSLFECVHPIDGEEERFFGEGRSKIKRPPDTNSEEKWRARPAAGDEDCLNDEFFDLVNLGRKQHGDPGHIFSPGSLRENCYREFLSRPDVDDRDPGSDVVVGIFPGYRINNVWPERNFLSGPADSLRYCTIDIACQRDIGRD